MKPKQLVVSAWGPYRGRVEVDFERAAEDGIYLITGPTGAGKTALFDAIAFALYGNVSGQVREKDSLRSDFALEETPTFVELSFTHRKKEYKVHRSPRYLRPKKRGGGVTTEPETAWISGPEGPMAQGALEVTEKVRALLGLDHQQFKQLSMIAQGEFMELLTASSRERTQILRNVFGTEQYEEFQQKLAGQARELFHQVEEQRHRMEEALGAVDDLSLEWKELAAGPDYAWDRILDYLKASKKQNKKENALLEQELEELEGKYKAKLEAISAARLQKKKLEEYEQALKEACVLEQQVAETERQKAELEDWKKAVPVREYLREQESLKEKQEAYKKADEIYKREKEQLEFWEDCYQKAAAGLLARDLKEGHPCPVCGSCHHPKKASLSLEAPTENQLKQLKKSCESKAKEASKLQEQCAGAYARFLLLEKQLMEQVPEFLEDSGKEKLCSLARRPQPDTGRMERQIAQYEERVARARERLRQLEHGIYAGQAKELLEADAETRRQKLEQELYQFTERFRNQEQMLRELEEERRAKSRQKERLAVLMDKETRAFVSLKEHREIREQLEQRYGIVSDLEKVARGQNPKRLVFEQYVLAGFFEQILSAANLRLQRMTEGRYLLSRSRQVSDARTKESMELQVLDAYTGKYRSAKTLSGGESFQAALSLALGMSDVIQSYAGGIEIEALFLDEGFGTLDQEALDQAIRVLTALTRDQRSIGIISHVSELKERISHQIRVERTGQGSSISLFL